MKQDLNVDVHSKENVNSTWLANWDQPMASQKCVSKKIKGDRRDGKITSDPLQDNSCELDALPIAVCRGDLKSGNRVSQRSG